MSRIINPATGKPFAAVKPSSQIIRLREEILRRLHASKYDAAQTTSQNELHWASADTLSPNSVNTLSVRRTLRSRSRYEAANNGYLKGILLSLANDFVGSGPTLQITDDRFTDEQKSSIEKAWSRRAKKIKLRRKLWRLRMAKAMDGEGFAFSYIDSSLKDQTKLNQRVFECDYVSHFDLSYSLQRGNNEVDGIRFNRRSGEPEYYHLLNEHPGEAYSFALHPLEGTWYPASQVIHWFRQDRGWLRGIPETTPTLPLWALLRRYSLAVVQNAEIAADFTVLLKSLQPPYQSAFPLSGSPGEPTEEDPDDWFASFPVDRGLMTVLPSHYDLDQLKPAQPVTVYDDFVNALVQEASRPLLVPRNLALGNSGGYNMSSGTLDRQMYRLAIEGERDDCNEEVLDKDLAQWWYMAVREPDYFRDEVTPRNQKPIRTTVLEYPSLRDDAPEHLYRWDEIPEHVDPVKVAQAIDILHKGRHISDIDIQERRFNRRVEDHYANLRKQEKARKDLGLSSDSAPASSPDGFQSSSAGGDKKDGGNRGAE